MNSFEFIRCYYFSRLGASSYTVFQSAGQLFLNLYRRELAVQNSTKNPIRDWLQSARLSAPDAAERSRFALSRIQDANECLSRKPARPHIRRPLCAPSPCHYTQLMAPTSHRFAWRGQNRWLPRVFRGVPRIRCEGQISGRSSRSFIVLFR